MATRIKSMRGRFAGVLVAALGVVAVGGTALAGHMTSGVRATPAV